MALLKFNKNNHELKVEVGVLEEYKPDREVKRIYNKLTKLKEKAENKLFTLTKTDNVKEAREKLNSKKIEDKWKKYLEKEYYPELKDISLAIHSKNKKLCEGYKETTIPNK